MMDMNVNLMSLLAKIMIRNITLRILEKNVVHSVFIILIHLHTIRYKTAFCLIKEILFN